MLWIAKGLAVFVAVPAWSVAIRTCRGGGYMCLLWERIEVLVALQRRRICIGELVSHDDAKLYCKDV